MHDIIIFTSGMYYYIVHLANALSNLCNIKLLVPHSFQKSTFSKFIDDRIAVIYYKKFKFWDVRNVASLKEILKEIFKNKPYIIHFPGNKPIWTPLLHLLLKGKYPIVSTVHEPCNRYIPRHDRFIVDSDLKFSDSIIVTGESIKRLLVSNVKIDENKCFSVPLGPHLLYRNFMKNDVEEEENTVLFFGKITWNKGLEYLIRAEKIVSREIKNFKIIIAGQGKFSLMSRLNPSHYEVHNYYIPDEKVADFFQRACLVTLPYVFATQSGVIPTAYAFLKPVIVSNIGALPELVDQGKTGLIIPPRNVKALAGSILMLLNDSKLRRRMKESIHQKIQTELSWDNIAKKTLNVYEETYKKFLGGFPTNRSEHGLRYS